MTTEKSLDEYLDSIGTEQNETEEVVEETTEEVVEEVQEEVVEEEVVETTEEEIPTDEELPIDKQLSIVSKLFGMEFKAPEEVEAFKAKLANLDSAQKNAELIPKLVDKIKASQNILSYFNNDEAAYKAAQLAKDPEYKGKEAVVSKVLRSNISELHPLEVIQYATALQSPAGVKNAYRATMVNMDFDPDLTIDQFNTLSEDDQDRIRMAAYPMQKTLANLGADIQIPAGADLDVLTDIEAEISRNKEDLTTKRNSIAPISQALIADLKELEVVDGFKFKVQMSSEERKEVEDFVTEAVLSKEYDLSTPAGKAEMWDAVKDLVRINHWAEIISATTKHVKEEAEASFRAKSNNAKPVNKNEPAPLNKTAPKNELQDAAIEILNEYN